MRGTAIPDFSQTPPAAMFDRLADSYDRVFTDSLIGKAQRRQVWDVMDHDFTAGQRILEINCGTGVDALHLAERGVHVTACDSSQRMVEVCRERISKVSLAGSSTFRVLATESIGELRDQRPFDGALSNFAGLNCVSDLASAGRQLARMLRPGAKALMCVFGKFCLWEIIWYSAQAEFGKAFRRLRNNVVHTGLGNIRYQPVHELTRSFAPHFRLLQLRGIGVAVPPSYLEPWALRFPFALQSAAKVDSWAGRLPVLRDFGDHILLRFERCPT
jgi:ubiquinone/menaquinone biosynthesis C-methylase UbiE